MALFQELYLKIRNSLEHNQASDRDLGQAGQWMREQVTKLLAPPTPEIIAELTDDYLTNFTPAEIVEHLRLRRELGKRQILTVPHDLGDHWSILFISRDRTGLLSRICGILALHNLNVLTAKIHTWQDGTVVDLVEVRPAFATKFASQNWEQLERDLNLALANRLGLAHRLADKHRPGFSPKVGQPPPAPPDPSPFRQPLFRGLHHHRDLRRRSTGPAVQHHQDHGRFRNQHRPRPDLHPPGAVGGRLLRS